MSKLTLFLFFALTTYVLNQNNKKITDFLENCVDLTIGTTNMKNFVEDYEEDYCSVLKTTDDKTHCCYFESKNGINGCYQITDDQYENIVRFKKYLRDQIGDDDIGIQCSSRFISFSLLAVLALLF